MSTLSITSQSSLLLYGDEMKFSTNQAWKDIRGDDVHVPWEKLIWFTNCIPRHTFITWLAIKNKLMTQDKLIKWTRLVTIKTRGTNSVTEVERAWDIRMQRMCDLNVL
ncbi:reverse transcriptase zinc-binding domain-containing protein [Artemisia annua]|uniref:Reverse transcriptase zinc-binding domain-containing protein n=1 Tax=Artemisia annua TaxID=35608 RepID=A0A2U1KDT6_ARTAN|nr:reverse transcriptase zinc-binding domain-containing protein [Artemisia annua]